MCGGGLVISWNFWNRKQRQSALLTELRKKTLRIGLSKSFMGKKKKTVKKCFWLIHYKGFTLHQFKKKWDPEMTLFFILLHIY